jgi:hypothetical protein
MVRRRHARNRLILDEVIIEKPAAEEMSLCHRQTDALSQDLAS